MKGSDQTQTSNCGYGTPITQYAFFAQEFKPTKDKLTAVALSFFKTNSPPSSTSITVSIRDELEGDDLVTISVNADDWKIKGETWVLFDFDDITVTPEESYYIVCTADNDDEDNSYAWFFNEGNTYDKGISYIFLVDSQAWVDLDTFLEYWEFTGIDFSFITYHQEPQGKMMINPILRFLENYPLLYSLLQQLLIHRGLLI